MKSIIHDVIDYASEQAIKNDDDDMIATIDACGAVIDQGSLFRLFRAQARSAEMWIQQYESYKDISGVRNAAMAIGKVAGHYNVLLSTGVELPEDIIEIQVRMNNIWSSLECVP